MQVCVLSTTPVPKTLHIYFVYMKLLRYLYFFTRSDYLRNEMTGEKCKVNWENC